MTALSAAALLAVLALIGHRWRSQGGSPIEIGPLALSPGMSCRFRLGGDEMLLAVPDGPDEAHSIGTFSVKHVDGEFDSGSLERDGGVESVMTADINSDSKPDALITMRCAGSGSYVTLFAVLSSATGYEVCRTLKDDSGMSDTYIVMLTARGQEEDERQALVYFLESL